VHFSPSSPPIHPFAHPSIHPRNRSDGDVYRAMLEMAQVTPLNATEEGPAWETVLKPAMLRNNKPLPKL